MTDIITPAQWTFNYPNPYYIQVDGINFYYEGAFKSYSISAPDSSTVRFQLEPGDQYAYDISRYKSSERDEIAAVNNVASNLQPLEISYGLTVEPGAVSTAQYLVLGQIHQNLADTTATGGPVMEVDLAAGDILEVNANYTDASGVLHSYALWQSPTAIVRGHQYAIDIKFVADPTGSSGRLVVSVDGQTVVDYHGQLGDPNMQGVYWAEGIYRSSTAAQTIAADFSNLQITTGSSVILPPSVTQSTISAASNGTYNVTLSETAASNSTLAVYDAGTLVGSGVTDANGSSQIVITGLTAGLHQLSSQTTNAASGAVGPMSGSTDILIATAGQVVQQLPTLAADFNLAGIQLTDTQVLPVGASSNLAGVLGYAAVLNKISGTVFLQTRDTFTTGAYDTDIKTYSLSGVLTEDARYLSGKLVTDVVYNGNAVSSTSYAADGSYTNTIIVGGQTTSASNHNATGQINWLETVFQDGGHEYDYYNSNGSVTKSSVYRADGTRVDVTYNTTGVNYAKSFNYVNSAGKTILSGSYDANGRLISNSSFGASGTTIVTYQYSSADGHLSGAAIQNPDGSHSQTSYASNGITVTQTTYYSSSNAIVGTDTSNPVMGIPSIASIVAYGAALHPSFQTGHESTLANGNISVGLSGTAAAGTQVTLYDAGSAVSTAIADATGHVAFVLSSASQGVHQYSATGLGANGTVYTLGAVSVDVEPLVVSIGSTGGATNIAKQTVSGLGLAGTALTVYDGTTAVANTTVSANGTWQATVTLVAQGAHNIQVLDTDSFGNTGLSNVVSYTYDTTPPKVTITAPGGLVGVPAQSITGTGESGTTITVYDGTSVVGTTTVIGSGFWRVPITMSGDGVHNISAVDTDAAGNSSTTNAVSYTLDTTPPVVSITSGAGTTNYPVQTITGTGEAGTTISVYDNSKLSTTTTVASNGIWSASITMNGNYQHSVYALDKDAAGNVGSSHSVLYNLSTVAIANVGGLTNIASQTISGTGEPGASVIVFDGTTAVANTTISSTGTWSANLLFSGDGSHRLYAQDTDAGNNVGFSNVVTYTLDTTAPTIVIGSAGGLTNQPLQTLNGTGEAGTLVTLYADGNAQASTTVNADGTWAAQLSLGADGTHNVQATDTDAAGNIGTSGTISYILDTTPPAVSLSGNPGGLTNQPSQVLTGIGEPGTSITVFDGGTSLATTTVGSNGNWSIALNLGADGSHNLIVSDIDAAGNVGTTSVTYTLDTTPPVPTIISAGGLTNQVAQSISGTGEFGTTVTIYDGTVAAGSAVVDASGNWTAQVTLAGNGAHSLVAQDIDAAGNVGRSAAVSFTLDTVAPTAPLMLADASIVKGVVTAANDTNLQLLTGSSEANATVNVYDGTTLLGSTTSSSNGAWNYTLGKLIDGNHSISATATDAAGNVGASSAPLTFSVHATLPAAPAGLADTAANAGYVNAAHDNSAQKLTGIALAGAVVTIFDGSTQIGTTIATSSGNWSYSLGKLSDGLHSLSSSVTDGYGNVSSLSAPLNVTVDTIAPVTTINDVNTSTGMAVISGQTESNSNVSVIENVNGIAVSLGTATSNANGLWTLSLSGLSDKLHVITAQATDLAGNVGGYSGITELGSSGNDTIKGLAQGELMIGGGGNDQLIAGTGIDSFVFHQGSGKDTISSFDLNNDRLLIDHSIFSNTGSVFSHTADVNGNAVISFSATDNVTLIGVTTSQLQAHQNDILFI